MGPQPWSPPYQKGQPVPTVTSPGDVSPATHHDAEIVPAPLITTIDFPAPELCPDAPQETPAADGFRWQFEHALEKSDLAPLTCWLLNRIASRADTKTGMIRGRYMPAEASLAAATHMSLRSVRDHLKLAEEAGWLIIERVPGFKSGFALAIPDVPIAPVPPVDNSGTPAGAAGVPDVPIAPVPPVDNSGTPAGAAGVPRQELPPVQTFSSDQRSKSSSVPQPDNYRPGSISLPDDDFSGLIIRSVKIRHHVDINGEEARHLVDAFLSRVAGQPPANRANWFDTCIKNEPDILSLLPARPAAPRPDRGHCGQCDRTGMLPDENGYPDRPCPTCRPGIAQRRAAEKARLAAVTHGQVIA
jgi:hypothetical protein